ncbi:MAG TPA: hypothetical protein VIP56_09320 [Nitrososphaeraceae archaeon]
MSLYRDLKGSVTGWKMIGIGISLLKPLAAWVPMIRIIFHRDGARNL